MNRVLVVGAARSGVAVSMLLRKHQVEVVLTDLHEIKEKAALEELGVLVYENGHPEELIQRYDLVVKNPGISLHAPFVVALLEQGNAVVCEIEVAYRYAKNFRYAAITGTNGKTTTTSILHAMLQRKDSNAQVAGNIGLPLSAVCLDHEEKSLDVALEVSNFQLLSMPTFRPFVSTVLNLTPDHLDAMDGLEHYYQTKMNVYQQQNETGYFLRNVDDEEVMKYAQNIPCQVLDFSLVRDDVDVFERNHLVYYKDTLLFDVREFSLVGRHNLQNAMVAATMAYLMGVSVTDIQIVLKGFKSVEHRIEYVDEIAGVRYYNDSKGTNVDATKIAIRAFENKVILIVGGKDKHTGFAGLVPEMDHVKTLIAFGQTKDQLAELKEDAIVVKTLEVATKLASKLAVPGDVVLFSPACSSFDQFTDYEQRGRLFKEYVKNLERTL